MDNEEDRENREEIIEKKEPKQKEHSSEKNKGNNQDGLMDRLKENPWMVSTAILAILALILILPGAVGRVTGNVVSGNSAAENLLAFYESGGATGLSIDSVEKISGVYRINFNYQGQVVPVYTTIDGKYAGTLSPIVQQTETSSETGSVEIVKSDKPKVELFIWGYCPYGVQAQGPLAEVAELLKDKADFSAVLYYDGHGEFETQQNKIQECIQKLEPTKYWSYAAGFVNDVYPVCSQSRDVACDKTESVKVMKSVGINSDAVMSCVDSQGEDLIAKASDYSSELGVQGSPTLIINGVKVNTARNAEAFKEAVCSAFNTEPSECSETLSSTASSGTTASCG